MLERWKIEIRVPPRFIYADVIVSSGGNSEKVFCKCLFFGKNAAGILLKLDKN